MKNTELCVNLKLKCGVSNNMRQRGVKCCAGGIVHRGVVLQTMNIRLSANQKEARKYMANDGIDYCYKQEV